MCGIFFMSRYHSYLASAVRLIDSYPSGTPFSMHAKKFFAADKKYGSRDRRTIASLCYDYFRLSHAFKKSLPLEEKIITSLFISLQQSSDCLQALHPLFNEKVTLPVQEKISFANLSCEDIFPFSLLLSSEIDPVAYALSFLTQPDVFVRIRPTYRQRALKGLEDAGITFEWAAENTLRVKAATSIDQLLTLNKEAVIQDLYSQQVFNRIKEKGLDSKKQQSIRVWDCCAASGGKAILLQDMFGKRIQLTVSDIRENILKNLSVRLQQAGIRLYNRFAADLTRESGLPLTASFDWIVCDAPCTGSGTWSRTPEQLSSFKASEVDRFVATQQSIVSNVLPHLITGGLFIYITCSVFEKENEGMVHYIKDTAKLSLVDVQYLKGYQNAADTMFVAIFKK